MEYVNVFYTDYTSRYNRTTRFTANILYRINRKKQDIFQHAIINKSRIYHDIS